MKKLSLIALTILLFSCGEPTINGKLVNNFENPIENAKVEIEGTAFTTQTNSNGEYSINFVPGDIKLKFSKENVLDTSLVVNIAVKEDFPAQMVKTYEVPQSGEINYFDKNNYINIPKVSVKQKRSNYTKEKDFAYIRGPFTITFEQKSYYAELDDKTIPSFKKGEMLFIDSSENGIGLVKLQKDGNKYNIVTTGEPLYYYDNFGKKNITKDSHWGFWGKNNFIRKTSIKTKYQSLNNQNNGKTFGLRPYNLKPGYYAFCIDLKTSIEKPINTEYVLAFQVVE